MSFFHNMVFFLLESTIKYCSNQKSNFILHYRLANRHFVPRGGAPTLCMGKYFRS